MTDTTKKPIPPEATPILEALATRLDEEARNQLGREIEHAMTPLKMRIQSLNTTYESTGLKLENGDDAVVMTCLNRIRTVMVEAALDARVAALTDEFIQAANRVLAEKAEAEAER